MTAYSITYDLSTSGKKDYEGLHEAIKQQGDWWHYLDSTWLVKTDETPSKIWQRLKPHMDKRDDLLIIEIRDNVSGWLPQKAWKWIHDHVPK